MLRPIAVEHGWSPEKVNKGGLRNAVQTLSVSASPSILFVDLSESGDPLNDINSLAEVCEPGTVVIAAGQVNDVRLYRDLVASGIQDYLLKPFSPDQLRDAFANAQMTISGPRMVESGKREAERHGRRDRRPRRRRRLDHRDLARLADGRQGRPLDRPARPRRPFRHRRARARPRARPRPHRRDRESEPHRRPVHRAGDGPRQRQALRAFGRSADQPVDADRRLGLLSAAGRDPPRLRRHGDRSAAQHDGAISAPARRRPCRHRRRRVHPVGHPRRDPHPLLAQGQCAAGPGDRGRQPLPDRRPGGEPQGFRAFDRAQGRHRPAVRPEDRGPGRQARPAARQGDQVGQAVAAAHTSCSR